MFILRLIRYTVGSCQGEPEGLGIEEESVKRRAGELVKGGGLVSFLILRFAGSPFHSQRNPSLIPSPQSSFHPGEEIFARKDSAELRARFNYTPQSFLTL